MTESSRSLEKRLTSRSFLRAARALDYMKPHDAKLARAYYCQGLSQRTIARELNLPIHELRQRLGRVEAILESIEHFRRHSATVPHHFANHDVSRSPENPTR